MVAVQHLELDWWEAEETRTITEIALARAVLLTSLEIRQSRFMVKRFPSWKVKQATLAE